MPRDLREYMQIGIDYADAAWAIRADFSKPEVAFNEGQVDLESAFEEEGYAWNGAELAAATHAFEIQWDALEDGTAEDVDDDDWMDEEERRRGTEEKTGQSDQLDLW